MDSRATFGRAAFFFLLYLSHRMNPNDQANLDSDGTGGLELEGIIIETSTPADTTSLGGATNDQNGNHIADDLLEEGGIEILKNGRAIDLNDPDLI